MHSENRHFWTQPQYIIKFPAFETSVCRVGRIFTDVDHDGPSGCLLLLLFVVENPFHPITPTAVKPEESNIENTSSLNDHAFVLLRLRPQRQFLFRTRMKRSQLWSVWLKMSDVARSSDSFWTSPFEKSPKTFIACNSCPAGRPNCTEHLTSNKLFEVRGHFKTKAANKIEDIWERNKAHWGGSACLSFPHAQYPNCQIYQNPIVP